jgi:hypothetical protein
MIHFINLVIPVVKPVLNDIKSGTEAHLSSSVEPNNLSCIHYIWSSLLLLGASS